MDKLLDSAEIIIDLKMKGNYLAQVTLCWQNVFEVRYFRLTLTKENIIWFQPPATGKQQGRWFKCFIVKDTSQWHKLQEKVIKKFFNELEKKVNEGIYSKDLTEKLKNHCMYENLSEKEIDKISENITHNHL